MKFFKKFISKKSNIFLVIGLLLVLIGSVMASLTQTNFGKFDMYSMSIECDAVTSTAQDKQQQTGVKETSVADFYVPKDASSENKYPLVFVVPGIQRTKETQASFCIELIRRGYAVICIDPSAQGDSSSSYETQAATQEGYGLFHWMDYLFEEDQVTLKEEFSWVDASRIGACGHSAGGNACQKFAEREGKLSVTLGIPSRVKAVYITGYIREFTWKNTQCSVGISYSQKDEGAFQNKTRQTQLAMAEAIANGKELSSYSEIEQLRYNNGIADLRYAEESIALVNYQLNRNDTPSSIETVEIGKLYGNPFKNNNFVIINNENCLHSLQPYDAPTLVHLVSFFNYVFKNDTAIADTNVNFWWGKEIGSGLGLVGGFITVLALVCVLLRVPFFASLKHELPARTGDQKVKGRIFFWVAFVIGATLACYLYMVCVRLSTEGIFYDAYKGNQTWVFPQRFTNAVMLWAVINGIIGVVIFFITFGLEWLIDYIALKNKKVENEKEQIVELRNNYVSKLDPMKISSLANVGKGLLLVAILVCTFFGLDYLSYLIFHVDFRFMFVSARVSFNPNVIKATMMYIPFFFIFYLSNSFRVNCSMRPSNWPEWLSQVIAVLGNTLGLVAIVLIEYIPMATTGVIGYTDTLGPQWLFVNLLFSIIPMMILLPLFNRYFFNQTGRAWIGALVSVIIFIAMTGAATTIYYAL